MPRRPFVQRKVLFQGASWIAVGALMAGGQVWAQTAPPSSASDSAAATDTLTEVVVTARRAAIESAQMRKKNADLIVDSVVADDAGKLPDNSITEVLQRVSGVTIVRFSSLGNPDGFSAEGSGIQVRGLSGVAARLNGREIFSASGGRGLSWGDVTPELMSAVDVFKSSTADLIEGGTGGSIDLRTKMPFDYNKPAFQASVDASHGDLVKKTTGGGSFLATKRWDTNLGEFGVLVDLARSKFSSNADFIRMEPYYKTQVGNDIRYIPGGYDYGDQGYTRTRTGAYLALEWKPTDDLRFYQTAFQSKYREDSQASGLFVVSKDLGVSPTGNNVWDSNGGLIKSDSVFLRDNATGLPATGNLFSGGNVGVSKGISTTRDFATGFKWTPERWSIAGAVQIVDSSSTRDNYDVFPGVPFPGSFSLDLSGDLPQIILPASAAAAFKDASLYEWQATMDHKERNHGHLYAGNIDVEYNLSDDAFFRSVKFGARYADRTERDNNSGYNWTALGRGWNGSPQLHFSDARPGDVEPRSLENFFRGKINLPGDTLMPSLAMVRKYDVVGDHTYYGGLPVSPIGFGPFDFSRSRTVTSAAYGIVRFASDDSIFGVPTNGNVGLRVVRTENTSEGFFRSNGATFLKDGVLTTTATTGQNRSDGKTFTRVLPSINIQFVPTDAIHVRFAYNVTVDNASFNALRASGEASVRTQSGVNGGPGVFDGFTTTAGNPTLKPVLSNNLDASIEWYPSRSTTLHLALFHKRLENLLIYGQVQQPVSITYLTPTAVTKQESAQSDNVTNSQMDGKINGLEFGGRTFFDKLPAPFDGLGVEFNYTLIDSSNPGDSYQDINGVRRTDVPISGLSKYNANLTALYEKGRLSARVAYSWRSEYLMSTNSNGTNGDYTPYTPSSPGTFTDIALPVYADDYGSLDAGVTFKVNDHLNFSVEGSNLTNEVTRTLMGGYNNGQKYIRSWFVSDRRISASMKVAF